MALTRPRIIFEREISARVGMFYSTAAAFYGGHDAAATVDDPHVGGSTSALVGSQNSVCE